TVLQFVRNIRRQPGVATEQTGELEAAAQALRRELMAQRLAGRGFVQQGPCATTVGPVERAQ
ncbi:hypothetical protein AB3X89_40440, partial [Paraburkholderia sp. BR14320]|uniref:hypothetical protein n=1 Tax=unclassified Paraburkholderia TaxID=2615204 RepID=UPI0034CF5E58